MDSDYFIQYCQQIANYPLLPEKEARNILEKAKAGHGPSVERVVKAHLKLVVSIAQKFRRKGVDSMDLVGEGNLAIYRALESFDLKKHTEFSTWAYFKIMRAMQDQLGKNAFDFKVPTEWVYRIGKLTGAIRDHVSRYGRDPTFEELSLATNFHVRTIERMFPVAAGRVSEMSNRGNEDAMANQNERVAQNAFKDPDDALEGKDLGEYMRNLVKSLDQRSARVVRMVYGIDGPVYTKAQIAKKLKLTPRYISKILERSLEQISEQVSLVEV